MIDQGLPADLFGNDNGSSQRSWDAGDRTCGNDAVWMSDLDVSACWALLGRERTGRIGFVRNGRVHVSPVNHLVDDGSIVLRTDCSSRLGELHDGDDVVFEVDDTDPDTQTGWSVIVHGLIVTIHDSEHRQELVARGLQPWAPGPKDRFVRIVPSSLTGRAISRRRRQADDTFLPYMPPD